jgi:hypothetical protein
MAAVIFFRHNNKAPADSIVAMRFLVGKKKEFEKTKIEHGLRFVRTLHLNQPLAAVLG